MKLTREELLTQQRRLREALDWVESKIRESDAPSPDEKPPLADSLPPVQHAPEIVHDDYTKEVPKGLSKGSQVGCVVFAVIAGVLFLFILFGLPYIIYDDEVPAKAEPVQSR